MSSNIKRMLSGKNFLQKMEVHFQSHVAEYTL